MTKNARIRRSRGCNGRPKAVVSNGSQPFGDGSYSSRRRCGFTLMEMVAAMVLMTILFAAMSSLLRSFANQRRALDRIAENNPPTQQLSDLLRRDLVNARSIRRGQNSLTLTGNIAQDWDTRSLNGRLAEVTYEIQSIAKEPWLVRREIYLDATSNQHGRTEPIWRGATNIELIATSGSTTENSGMPSRMRVVVNRDSRSDNAGSGPSSKPLIDLHVVHHWEDN